MLIKYNKIKQNKQIRIGQNNQQEKAKEKAHKTHMDIKAHRDPLKTQNWKTQYVSKGPVGRKMPDVTL